MNSIHDCGGLEGLGPLAVEAREPVFHAEWERRVFALLWAAGFNGFWNLDEFRHAIERMSAEEYLRTSYYEHWLHGLETLLTEKGVVSRAELREFIDRKPTPPPDAKPPMTVAAVASVIVNGGSLKKIDPIKGGFQAGDRVYTKNIHPHGHTRLPRYARGKRGVIEQDRGVFPFPDTNAHGKECPQHVYTVKFSAREIWGLGASEMDTVCLDLWEDHLTHGR